MCSIPLITDMTCDLTSEAQGSRSANMESISFSTVIALLSLRIFPKLSSSYGGGGGGGGDTVGARLHARFK